MKWPQEILILRHGQSARNVQKTAAMKAGSKADYSEGVRDQDTPLTDRGMLQAEAVGKYLREQYAMPIKDAKSGRTRNGFPPSIDTVFVSPYLRARQTAERIIYCLGYQPKQVIEERIREIEFGIVDGLTRDGLKAKYPEELARKAREGKYWYRPPGGESRPDVRLRCHSFLGTLSRDYTGQIVVVDCHSVVVLSLRSLLERWGEEQYLIVDKENDVLNCSLTRYVYDEGREHLMLDYYNKVVYSNELFSKAG